MLRFYRSATIAQLHNDVFVFLALWRTGIPHLGHQMPDDQAGVAERVDRKRQFMPLSHGRAQSLGRFTH
jgi:hypothetical protein